MKRIEVLAAFLVCLNWTNPCRALPKVATHPEASNVFSPSEFTASSSSRLPTAQDAHKWVSIKATSVYLSWSDRFSIAINKAVTAYSLFLNQPRQETEVKAASAIIHDTNYMHHELQGLKSGEKYYGELQALVGPHKWPYKLLNFTVVTPTLLSGPEASIHPKVSPASDISDLEGVSTEVQLRWTETPYKTDGIPPSTYLLKLWQKDQVLREIVVHRTSGKSSHSSDEIMETSIGGLALDKLYKITLQGRNAKDIPGITLSFSLTTGSLFASESVFMTGGVAGCFSALQVRCPNSDRCVSPYWICDGSKDCPEGEDEDGCDEVEPCQNGFRCWGSSKCLPASWRCDGYEDCLDGDDELGCSNCESEDLLRCGTGSDCVSVGYACDGQKQCPDGWDETDAICNHVISNFELGAFSHEFECQDGKVSCGQYGGCVSKNSLCDDVQDCPSGEDENYLFCKEFKNCTGRANHNASSDEIFEFSSNLSGESHTVSKRTKQNSTSENKLQIPETTTIKDSHASSNLLETQNSDEPARNITEIPTLITSPEILKFYSNTLETSISTPPQTSSQPSESPISSTHSQTSESPISSTHSQTSESPKSSTHSLTTEQTYSQTSIPTESSNPEPFGNQRITNSATEPSTADVTRKSTPVVASTTKVLTTKAPKLTMTESLSNSAISTSKCRSDEFDCGDGWCVPLFWLCDGRFDCLDGADEDPKTCETVVEGVEQSIEENYIGEVPNHVEVVHCPDDHLKCSSGLCIDKPQICDGVNDCPEKEDEHGCGKLITDIHHEEASSEVVNNEINEGHVKPSVTFLEGNDIQTVLEEESSTILEEKRPIVLEEERPIVLEEESPIVLEKESPSLLEEESPSVLEEESSTVNVKMPTYHVEDIPTVLDYEIPSYISNGYYDNTDIYESIEELENTENPHLVMSISPPKIQTNGSYMHQLNSTDILFETAQFNQSKDVNSMKFSEGFVEVTNAWNDYSSKNTSVRLHGADLSQGEIQLFNNISDASSSITVERKFNYLNITDLSPAVESDLKSNNQTYTAFDASQHPDGHLPLSIEYDDKFSNDYGFNETKSISNNETQKLFRDATPLSNIHSSNYDTYENESFVEYHVSDAQGDNINTMKSTVSYLDALEEVVNQDNSLRVENLTENSHKDINISSSDWQNNTDVDKVQQSTSTEVNNILHDPSNGNVTFKISGTTSEDGFLVLSTTSSDHVSTGNSTVLIAVHAEIVNGSVPDFVIHSTNGTQFSFDVISVINKPLRRNKIEAPSPETSKKSYILEKVITFRIESNGKLQYDPVILNSPYEEPVTSGPKLNLLPDDEKNRNVSCVTSNVTEIKESAIYFINQIKPAILNITATKATTNRYVGELKNFSLLNESKSIVESLVNDSNISPSVYKNTSSYDNTTANSSRFDENRNFTRTNSPIFNIIGKQFFTTIDTNDNITKNESSPSTTASLSSVEDSESPNGIDLFTTSESSVSLVSSISYSSTTATGDVEGGGSASEDAQLMPKSQSSSMSFDNPSFSNATVASSSSATEASSSSAPEGSSSAPETSSSSATETSPPSSTATSEPHSDSTLPPSDDYDYPDEWMQQQKEHYDEYRFSQDFSNSLGGHSEDPDYINQVDRGKKPEEETWRENRFPKENEGDDSNYLSNNINGNDNHYYDSDYEMKNDLSPYGKYEDSNLIEPIPAEQINHDFIRGPNTSMSTSLQQDICVRLIACCVSVVLLMCVSNIYKRSIVIF